MMPLERLERVKLSAAVDPADLEDLILKSRSFPYFPRLVYLFTWKRVTPNENG